MADAAPLVFVVDDDDSIRTALERLIRSVGFRVRSFRTARDFLAQARCDAPCCLILDVRMPQMSGLELQEKMAGKNLPMPIIFITGHGTVAMGVQAMKAGAVDFLEKPFEEQLLLDTIQSAIEKDRRTRQENALVSSLRQRADQLTPREREVFKRVVSGLLNKQIAAVLNISEKTIKVHRARVMAKMKADSLAALVRMADKIDLT